MTHDSRESELRSVSIETYTTLIAVILVSCVIISECFVVIYYILVSPPPNIIYHGYYIVLSVISIICVRVLFYKSVPEIKKLKSGNETALSEVAILFVITLHLSFICGIVLKVLKLDLPDFFECHDWRLGLSMLEASVYEEILCRVLCIGVPVLFIALITKKRDARLPLQKYLAGGFEINKLVLFLIFLSSFIFGVLHIKYWGMWKFYMTFIPGLILGYLFVKYGLYASISFHFLTDCLCVEGMLLGGIYIDLVSYIIAVVCLPCVYFYVEKRGKYFSKTLLKGKSN